MYKANKWCKTYQLSNTITGSKQSYHLLLLSLLSQNVKLQPCNLLFPVHAD